MEMAANVLPFDYYHLNLTYTCQDSLLTAIFVSGCYQDSGTSVPSNESSMGSFSLYWPSPRLEGFEDNMFSEMTRNCCRIYANL
jgi:hypothetical protein